MTRKSRPIDIFLQPGEYFVGNADYRIRTLLGSCVSITLWHPKLKIGAMSHFLLASRPLHARQDGSLDGRYADEVMSLMLTELNTQKVNPAECEGKIFGGGNMFPSQKHKKPNIGELNGESARRLLRSHRIALISESLFGIGHRQIYFDVSNGDVWELQTSPVSHAASPG